MKVVLLAGVQLFWCPVKGIVSLVRPYRDGTTHVVFEPLDFIARLVALVPKPRINLTRFHEVHPCTSPLRGSLRLCKSAILPICHGVFAPNSHLRAQVTPGQRDRHTGEAAYRTAAAGQVGMTWAQRLKRVFKLDIETCRHCGGAVKVAALAYPALAAFVHPCRSLPASKIQW